MYLYKELKAWANMQVPTLSICNPTDSWPAIVKGAVSHGLEGVVYRRKLQCHYGVQLDEPFDPNIHDRRFTYVDLFDNITLCSDCVTWFAAMGEDIESDRRIRVPFSFTTENRYEDLVVPMVSCRYNEPPKSFGDARAIKLPTLSIAMGSLPSSAFQVKKVASALTTVFRAHFTLEMVVQSASFSFEIRHDGRLLRTHRFGAIISSEIS